MNSTLKKRFPFFPVILISLLIAAVGIGCGGGGGSAPPPPPPTDQDAQGLYTTNGDGSGTFKDGAIPPNNIVKTLSDIKGMVYGDLPNQKFIFFDVATNVLYEGNITSITLTNFTGTAIVYNDGVMVDNNVAVSGTITSRSSIDMTLAASGDFVGGSIKGLFSSEYDKGATNARAIVLRGNVWQSSLAGTLKMVDTDMRTLNFEVFASNFYDFVGSTVNGSTRCDFLGNLTINNTNNIYILLDETVELATINPPPCGASFTPKYKGFASVLADNAQGQGTEMWYAITNGLHSVFMILTR